MTKIYYKSVLGKYIISKIENYKDFDNVCLHIDDVENGAVRIGKSLKRLVGNECVFPLSEFPSLICRPIVFHKGKSIELEAFEIANKEPRKLALSQECIRDFLIGIGALSELFGKALEKLEKIEKEIKGSKIF